MFYVSNGTRHTWINFVENAIANAYLFGSIKKLKMNLF